MRTHVLSAGALVVLLPALALAWSGGAPPPPETVTVALDGSGRSLTLGPYTANDYSGDVYDPVNLFFLDLDPREIRQALLDLNGERGMDALPFGQCLWADAMGSEQVAWAESEGWVGGEVQLVCINPAAPLGDPFRVHLRLYRQGDVTLGGAHFEILIPGTAQHQVLSWDFARNFVYVDMIRTGALTSAHPVAAQTPGTFREILRPIYDALYSDADGLGLLIFLGLAPYPPAPPPPGDVPIPTNGAAMVFAGQVTLDPGWTVSRSQVDVDYDVVTPRPFCATGPDDLVRLQGPVRLTLAVYTSPYGTYERRHTIRGTLQVTPMAPDGYTPTGPPVRALIREDHRAALTDRFGQLQEEGSQTLLGRPRQSLWWKLQGGELDRYRQKVTCGGPGHCRR